MREKNPQKLVHRTYSLSFSLFTIFLCRTLLCSFPSLYIWYTLFITHSHFFSLSIFTLFCFYKYNFHNFIFVKTFPLLHFSLFLSHSYSLCHTFFHNIFLIHTQTLWNSIYHNTHSLSNSLSQSHTLSLSRTLPPKLTLTITHTFSLTHSVFLSHTHSPSHTLSFKLTFTITHNISHTPHRHSFSHILSHSYKQILLLFLTFFSVTIALTQINFIAASSTRPTADT